MKFIICPLAAAVCALGLSQAAMAAPEAGALVGNAQELETVITFPDSFKALGIAVSKDGRIFSSTPSCKPDEVCVVEVNQKNGKMTPFPDDAWNRQSPDRPTIETWIEPMAMWIDRGNDLWVLDRSNVKLDQEKYKPKLVQFDLNTNQAIRTYTFEDSLDPKDHLNDLRIDLLHRYAYLTNTDNGGGLVVLNLDTGKSRQVLRHEESTFADPHQHLMFGSQIADIGGKPWAYHADGIALSPDNQWLYYRPLTDHNYWRIQTAALIDQSLTDKDLGAVKQYLGAYVMGGGQIMSDDCVIYVGDLEHKNVTALTPYDFYGKLRYKSRTFATNPELAWADGFAIYNGYLYVADSRINEMIFDNSYPRSGKFKIYRAKLPTPNPAQCAY